MAQNASRFILLFFIAVIFIQDITARQRTKPAFLYFSLRDGKNKLVRTYGDVLPSVAAEIQLCSFNDENTGALFRLSQANVEVIGTTFEHDEEYGSYVISCAAPKYDAVKEVAVLTLMLGNGTRLPSISVTEVQQTRLGAVAMCVAPIYTNRANMQDWLNHHESIGVEAFHLYVPVGIEFERFVIGGGYHRRPDRGTKYMYLDGIEQKAGEVVRHTKEGVTWHSYEPALSSFYFGQLSLLNACVFSLRHAYDFVLLIDTDEYLLANGSDPDSHRIAPWLSAALPETAASLWLPRYEYFANCPVKGAKDGYHHRYVTHWAGAMKNGKTAVRPLLVERTNVHCALQSVEGTTLEVREPLAHAYLKHIRMKWPGVCEGQHPDPKSYSIDLRVIRDNV